MVVLRNKLKLMVIYRQKYLSDNIYVAVSNLFMHLWYAKWAQVCMDLYLLTFRFYILNEKNKLHLELSPKI